MEENLFWMKGQTFTAAAACLARPHYFVTRDDGNQRLIYKPETGDKTPERKGRKAREGVELLSERNRINSAPGNSPLLRKPYLDVGWL